MYWPKGHGKCLYKLDEQQAKCESCFPKGQAGNQFFFLSPVEKHHFTRVLTTSFFISSSLSASTLFSCSMTSKSSGRDSLLLYFSSASSSLFKKKKTRSYIRKQSYDEKLYTNVPGLTSFLPLLSQFDLKINSRVILQNVGSPYTMLVKYLTSTRRRTAE